MGQGFGRRRGYDPLESSPDWRILDGASVSPFKIEDDTCIIKRSSSDVVVIRDIAPFVDGSVSCWGVFNGQNSDFSMPLAIRALDANNYTGFRISMGAGELYDRVDGTWNQLDTALPAPNAGTQVTLSAVGDQITVTINGTDYTYTGINLTAGYAGCIGRGWVSGKQDFFSNFTVTVIA